MDWFCLLLALVVIRGNKVMSALQIEPTCSKFDYEMKSLEAMLRTEQKVEMMLEKMKALKEATSQDLDKSKAFIETTRTEIGDLKSEIKTSLTEKVKKIEEKLESVNRRLDENLQTIETASFLDLNKAEVLHKSSIVAFSVTNPAKALVNGVPTFSDVITNIGNGYDIGTGVFTSPVDGLYVFLFNIGSSGNHYVYCRIQHNGSNKVIGSTYSDNSYTTASASVLLMLSKGDRVNPGDCGEWKNVYRSDSATTFSGALITQTNMD